MVVIMAGILDRLDERLVAFIEKNETSVFAVSNLTY